MSVKELFESMNWGDELVSWKDFSDYYRNDMAWKSDCLTPELLARDLRIVIENFRQLLGLALASDPATWQERLVLERDELKERIWKLETFLHAPVPEASKISHQKVSMLNAQLMAMLGYLGILEVRLAEQALEDLPKETSGEPV